MLELFTLLDSELTTSSSTPEVCVHEDNTPAQSEETLAPSTDLRLKILQIGIWEARRRWLQGDTNALGSLLANLDEDVQLLRLQLEDEARVATEC